jgi:acyl carrier protein
MRKFEAKNDIVRDTILALLAPAQSNLDFKEDGTDGSTKLLEEGVIDSKGLLDIILEVETRCDVRFNPEHVDFEKGLTLASLVAAFDAATL